MVGKKTRILITGASGFLGSYLLESLKKKPNTEITALSRSTRRRNGISWKKGDVHDYQTLKRVVVDQNIIIHAAGSIDENDPDLWRTNVDGTGNLVDAILSHAPKARLIHISSTGVFGQKIDETESYHPETRYEKSKTEAELQVLTGIQKGLKAIILRPTMIYGPNNSWKNIIALIRKGMPIIGRGDNNWHLVYVENVVHAIEKAMRHGKLGSGYIIADNEVHTLKEVYNWISNAIGREKEVRHVPLSLGLAGIATMEIVAKLRGKKTITTRSHAKRLLRERIFDISKTKSELKYKPPYAFEEGMTRTLLGLGYPLDL